MDATLKNNFLPPLFPIILIQILFLRAIDIEFSCSDGSFLCLGDYI